MGIKTKYLGAIPIDQIEESKANPRRDFKDLDELASSIKSQGVISPVMVRPGAAGKYELVYGARRLRAAAKAGLEAVPAIEAECSAEDAQALRLVENGQRADVHPLLEAQAIQRLFDKASGMTLEVIAAKLGRTPAYLRRRLELLKLPKQAQEVFLEGKMVLAVAQVLAGVSSPESREQAWQEAWKRVDNEWNGDEALLLDPDKMRQFIREEVLPDLARAPFKLDREDLGAVACTKCPTRTSAQADLFGEQKGAGHCLQPKCHKAKLGKFYEITAAEIKASGQGVVLSEKENKAALTHYGGFSQKYVQADQETWVGDKNVKPSTILKGKPEKRILAKGEDGAPVILYLRSDIEKRKDKAPSDAELSSRAREKREREQHRFEGRFVYGRILEEAFKMPAESFLELVALSLVGDEAGADFKSEPYESGIVSKVFARAEIQGIKAFNALAGQKRRQVLRELIIAQHLCGTYNQELELDVYDHETLFKTLGLDSKALEKKARAAFDAEEKKKAAEKKAPKTPPAPAKKTKKGKG